MYKLIFLILLIIFSGCSNKEVLVESKLTQSFNKKIFPEEDTLIIFALRAEEIQDYTSAATIFNTLYEKSLRREYIHRSLQNKLFLQENDYVIAKVNEIANESLSDFVLIRLKVIGLMQNGLYEEAQNLVLALVEESKDEADYILLSDIYGSQQKFDEAVKYLEAGYSQNYSEKILDKMSIFLYVNLDRKQDAIAYLKTHSMVHGCSITICKRLISFYSNDNDADGLLSSYLSYYKLDSKLEVAKKIVQIYAYKKEYAKLILFLEESGSDDKMLLQLYVSSKNYTKAFPISKKLYEDSGDTKYLGKSVIYEYESQKNKQDRIFLKIISKKFEEVLEQNQASLYLNYYGYILIDHEIDVNKGIRYIQKALLLEPKSGYYLDSLAWGYYKQNKCIKAFDIIEKVRELEGGNDPEVIRHYQMIKKCKGKNK